MRRLSPNDVNLPAAKVQAERRATRRRCLELWTMRIAALIAAMCVAVVTPSSAVAQPGDAAASMPTCQLNPGTSHTVARVIDGETIALDDGREVRLIGALAPRATDAAAASGTWPAEQSAVAFLSKQVIGERVQLAFGDGPRSDRYGRLLAHVFIGVGATRQWIQGEMLAAGWARAYTLSGMTACAHELLANERAARLSERGLWGLPSYRALAASRPGQIMKRRNHFERVSGHIATVARTASGVYVNFGGDWKTDFTIVVSKDTLKREPDFASRLNTLVNQSVTVRGWIERRNGPMIELYHSSQLEVSLAHNVEAAKPASNAPMLNGPAANDPAPADSDTETKKNRPDPPIETDPSGLQL